MAPQSLSPSGWFSTERAGDMLVLSAGGDWRTATLATLDRQLRALAPRDARRVRIDISAVNGLDTAGAWVLHRTAEQLATAAGPAELVGARPEYAAIIKRIVEGERPAAIARNEPGPVVAAVAHTGRAMIDVCVECASLLAFLGATTARLGHAMVHPRRIRFTALVSHLQQVGFNALPIVGLLAFLIGVVIAYQGADQLRRFGADIFTVNLVGVSILREMAILMTAIVLAGRSGSAFTAQIGTMQVNEEIDAMRTIGLDPIEMLVLPRVIALIIALPLLAIFADLMGLAGGALMSMVVLDMSLVQFLERLRSEVPVWNLWVGLIKAPFFGFLIGLIGCHEGLNVRGSAESVGFHTTRSVVVSIFLVIVVDAGFSIFFSAVGV
jgi:phospholipid/cholesterol/gamma-HCH transport system permease protein